MSRSSLHHDVGRLIVGRVQGIALEPEEKRALQQGTMGGVTLFRENARDLEQLFNLVAAIEESYPGTPLLTTDQEGGGVQRFDQVLTPLPSAMSLGANADFAHVASMAAVSAQQLGWLGLNCCLAPVLDVCTNPLNPIIGTRAFGSDPAAVKGWGISVAQAFKAEGLIAVGKHFPGHGDTLEDSHSLLAVNRVEAREFWQRELAPFRACASELPAMLTGHIWIPSVDEEPLPASLSPRVTSGLLREYLKYDGLVMTDDLLMKAITERFGLAEAAVLAVLAGADQVLVCGTMDDTTEVHAGLLAAVKSQRITQQRLQESLNRLERALQAVSEMQKQRKSLKPSKRFARLKTCVENDYSRALDSSVSSVTVLRGWAPPMESSEWVVVAPDHPRYKIDLARALKEELSKTGKTQVSITEKRYPLDPGESDSLAIAQYCANRNCIFVTFRTLLNKGQIQLGRLLSDSTSTRIAVAADVPYDIIGLPNWDNCLTTYDPSELAMLAAAMVLTGQKAAQGRCPVNLQIEI